MSYREPHYAQRSKSYSNLLRIKAIERRIAAFSDLQDALMDFFDEVFDPRTADGPPDWYNETSGAIGAELDSLRKEGLSEYHKMKQNEGR